MTPLTGDRPGRLRRLIHRLPALCVLLPLCLVVTACGGQTAPAERERDTVPSAPAKTTVTAGTAAAETQYTGDDVPAETGAAAETERKDPAAPQPGEPGTSPVGQEPGRTVVSADPETEAPEPATQSPESATQAGTPAQPDTDPGENASEPETIILPRVYF